MWMMSSPDSQMLLRLFSSSRILDTYSAREVLTYGSLCLTTRSYKPMESELTDMKTDDTTGEPYAKEDRTRYSTIRKYLELPGILTLMSLYLTYNQYYRKLNTYNLLRET